MRHRDTIFARLNSAFVSLGLDYQTNIDVLTATCGELFGATCCLYNRLNCSENILHSVGRWNTPEDYQPKDSPDGHICHDLICQPYGILYLRNLDESNYYNTDSCVSRYHLKTYLGHPVFCAGEAIGTLCLVYQEDHESDELEKQVITMLATAIGIEEDRLRAQQKLQIALDKAEQGNRAKSLFLSTMSHEIRTPLTSILGYADLLLLENHDSSTTEGLNIIRQSGKNLLSLINDILDYSRIEKGIVDLSPEKTNVVDLLNETVALHQKSAEKKHLTIELLLAVSNAQTVTCDAARLQQVLSNVIQNAIKYSTAGVILIQATTNKGSLEIRIKDEGCGFSPDNIERIFHPFFQERHGYSGHDVGTGLGLAICKSLIESMDGTIHAELPATGGAEFIITLQLNDENTVPSKSITPAIIANNPSHKTLLVVEDEPLNARLLVKILSNYGIPADIAAHGAIALEQMKLTQYAAILMDIRMPVMDGIEATRKIRSGEAGENNRNLPIIAITANAFPDDQIAYYTAGMNDFLSKPIVVEELLRRLRTYKIMA